MTKISQSPSRGTRTCALRLGFVPLTDCAPLVVAKEFGIFRQHGLQVSLSRELGWASIRDKIVYGELDAAHAVAGLPFAATLGLGSIPCACLTALVLNLHGNAITLSNELWRRGVRDGATLRTEVQRLRGNRTLTFGAVSLFSSHHFLLRDWLRASGLMPGRDVRIVIVPPPQMNTNLQAGHIDGFCVGEPWSSVAVESKLGWVASVSAEWAPGHPEKVLMVRKDFAEKRPAEHSVLIAALLEACQWCDAPQHRGELATLLARREYLDVSRDCVRRGLEGSYNFGHESRSVSDFCVFHRYDANEPSADKAAWVMRQIAEGGLCGNVAALNPRLGGEVFRRDLFDRAIRPLQALMLPPEARPARSDRTEFIEARPGAHSSTLLN